MSNNVIETTAVARRDGTMLDRPVPIEQVREQIEYIQRLMKSVMQQDQHYGVIPGCGTKPTLLKPGAEKLCFTFRLRPIINEHDIKITELGNGHREYRVTVHILNQFNEELATGVGSCSTMEGKYRYRSENTGRIVPQEYWQTRDPELIGGPQFSTRKIDGKWLIFHKVEHDNPADYYNTALKIAKKRGHVDGTITATSASDIFTQDVEDMGEPDRAPHREPPEPPRRQAKPPAKTTLPEGWSSNFTSAMKTIDRFHQNNPDFWTAETWTEWLDVWCQENGISLAELQKSTDGKRMSKLILDVGNETDRRNDRESERDYE